MRLLICDDERITYNYLPENAQDFYIVNYVSKSENISEMLTLEAINGVWNITGNKNIEIFFNKDRLDKAPLNIYQAYSVFFTIINKYIRVICIPDTEHFNLLNPSIENIITIGSDTTSTISCTLLRILEDSSIFVL